jgi:hypothetical protein
VRPAQQQPWLCSADGGSRRPTVRMSRSRAGCSALRWCVEEMGALSVCVLALEIAQWWVWWVWMQQAAVVRDGRPSRGCERARREAPALLRVCAPLGHRHQRATGTRSASLVVGLKGWK